MKITTLDVTPCAVIPYVNAAAGGRAVPAALPILRGTVDVLPASLSAILVASDLQGVAPSALDGRLILLGEALAEQLEGLLDGLGLPPAGQVGVLLCGDLYAASRGDQRGATGDVRGVWEALQRQCRFLAGVAGNHDLFGPAECGGSWAAAEAARRYATRRGMHLLDGEVVKWDGLRIAGVSGIMGNTGKPNRRQPGDFCTVLGQMLDATPDILVLHQGPDEPRSRRRGSPEVRELIEVAPCEPLVLCGHCHWDEPLATLDNGSQVLNADGRVVVLESRRASGP